MVVIIELPSLQQLRIHFLRCGNFLIVPWVLLYLFNCKSLIRIFMQHSQKQILELIGCFKSFGVKTPEVFVSFLIIQKPVQQRHLSRILFVWQFRIWEWWNLSIQHQEQHYSQSKQIYLCSFILSSNVDFWRPVIWSSRL
jgi:hypothetical protein